MTMLPIIKQPTGKGQCCPSSNSPLGNGNVAHHQTADWETAMLPIIKLGNDNVAHFQTGKRHCCPLSNNPLGNDNVAHYRTTHWETTI